MHYFGQSSTRLSKSKPAQQSESKLWSIFLIVLLVVAALTNFGLDIFNLRPVYISHGAFLLFLRLLTPAAAVFVLIKGPKGLVRLLGLIIFLPLSVLGLIIICFLNAVGVFKEGASGDNLSILGAHSESVKTDTATYVTCSYEGYEDGGETFTLVEYRKVVPFLYQKIRERDLPRNLWPRLFKDNTGRVFVEFDRDEKLLYSVDADAVLCGLKLRQ